ncbi:AAA family ATPase [Vibrio coralliirubri]|uniref:AAA family ATPase n=1 Tax=Vibrio coralliirubri TaxID=1516159 RepID=UPI000B35D678|nr:AAA family ATPase [Vibrio coralliirubri]
MSKYIRRVRVNGLFEPENNLLIDFDNQLNCVYGYNGTGKTVLLDLITNVLNVNIPQLQRSPFESITILISESKKPTKFVTVYNKLDDIYFEFHCDIEISSEVPSPFKRTTKIKKGELYTGYSRRDMHTHRMRNPQVLSSALSVDVLKKAMAHEIAITYVPLLRIGENNTSNNSHDRGSNRYLSTIQEEFSKQYAFAQSSIARKLEDLSSSILEKLFIRKDDSVNAQYEKMARKLIRTKKLELGTYELENVLTQIESLDLKIPTNVIEEHYLAWENIQKNLLDASINLDEINNKGNVEHKDFDEKKIKDVYTAYTKAYFTYLSTVGTYKKIQDAITEIEAVYYERSLLLTKFEDFKFAINDFLSSGKEFTFDDDGTFIFSNKGRPVKMIHLSSGEKNLIAILGHLCTSNTESSVFIADEPELSLHLEWQRKMLPTINRLSPNTQVIVATHSPSIIVKESRLIDIEECYSNA